MNTPPTKTGSDNLRSRLIVISTIIVAVLLGLVFAVFQLYRPRPLDATPVKAVTTLYPLTYLVGPILGDQKDLVYGEDEMVSIIPNDIDNHPPTPDRMETINDADVLFTLFPSEQSDRSPLDVEKFLEKFFLENTGGEKPIIALGEGVSLLPVSTQQEDYDIHVWMSPRRAAVMVENIQESLSSLYPDNSIFYRARQGEFLARLQELDQEFQQGLSRCRQDTIVVSHNAFAYLGQDYGFNVLSLYESGSGSRDREDLTPTKLMEVVKLVGDRGIPYLFYTRETDLEAVSVIADEMGIKPLPLHTLESPVLADFPQVSTATSEGYITVMEENLRLLSQGLGCQE